MLIATGSKPFLRLGKNGKGPAEQSSELSVQGLLAFTYFRVVSILLLFSVVEDWKLRIATAVRKAIDAHTWMSSAKALTIVLIIVQHGGFPFAIQPWALDLCNVLAHVVRLGTTAAFQLALLGVRKSKVRGVGLFALVKLAVVIPAWMGRAMTQKGIIVIVDEWELWVIAILVLAINHPPT